MKNKIMILGILMLIISVNAEKQIEINTQTQLGGFNEDNYELKNTTHLIGVRFKTINGFILNNVTNITYALVGSPTVRCQLWREETPNVFIENSSGYLAFGGDILGVCNFTNSTLTANTYYWIGFKCDDCTDGVTEIHFYYGGSTYADASQGYSLLGTEWVTTDTETLDCYGAADPDSCQNVSIYGFNLTYTLTGRILDGATLQPIVTLPSIKLKRGSDTFLTFTDINGFYTISGLESGNYNYTLTEPSYTTIKGVITIIEDTQRDFLLYKDDLNLSVANLDLSFHNDDNSPLINQTIRFTYDSGTCGAGCSSLIGREYFFTTDSNGKIDTTLAGGEYKVDKVNWKIKRNIDDLYADFVYFQFYQDISQNFWLINENDLSNVTFIIIDSSTGLEIANATVSLISTRHSYYNYTSIDGEVNFSMIDGIYRLLIRHIEYYPYPSIEHYNIDIREVGITGDYTEYIFLLPTSKDKYSIYGNVSDNNYLPINATVYLRGNGTFKSQNASFYNFTNLSKNNNYFIYASQSGYFDTPEELIYLITNTRFDIVMENISDVSILSLTINETNNLSNVKAELMDITNQESFGIVVTYTNTTGGASFYNIIKNHQYRLTLSKAGYRTNVTVFNFNEINKTFEFEMVEIVNLYTFSGYVYRQGSSPDYGVKGAKVSIFGTNDFITYTDSTGYFEITDIPYDDYILNITKTGYFSLLFMALSVYADVTQNYYIVIEEDVFSIGIDVFTNETIGLEGVVIRIFTVETEDFISTDANGRAEINLPKGKYNVELSKDKYISLTGEIIVTKHGDVFEFTMSKKAPIDVRIDEKGFIGFMLQWTFFVAIIVFVLFAVFIVLILCSAILLTIDKIKSTSGSQVFFMVLMFIILIVLVISLPTLIVLIDKFGTMI